MLVPSTRLATADACAMPNDDNEESPLQKRFGDLTFYLIGVGTIAVVTTCIRVWIGIDVMQTQINVLSKSYNQQEVDHRQLSEKVNSDISLKIAEINIRLKTVEARLNLR